MTPKVSKKRGIRLRILTMACDMFAGNPDACLLADHLYLMFSAGRTPISQEEIDAQVVDLIEDGMITVEDAPGVSQVAGKCYRSTLRGRNFFDAGCPWEKIDEFTGGQK